jgi:hypothetical protein
VDFGVNSFEGSRRFMFEKWWLGKSDFDNVVKKAWGLSVAGNDPMTIQQCKVRYFRRLARGWIANVVADVNKRKQEVTDEYNCLDIEAEERQLEEE